MATDALVHFHGAPPRLSREQRPVRDDGATDVRGHALGSSEFLDKSHAEASWTTDIHKTVREELTHVMLVRSIVCRGVRQVHRRVKTHARVFGFTPQDRHVCVCVRLRSVVVCRVLCLSPTRKKSSYACITQRYRWLCVESR